MSRTAEPAVLLDLDGTLVDSVYHHVFCWQQAFAAAGHEVSAHRIHLGIGMGSERLVPFVLGRGPDDLDDLVADHKRRFLDVAGTLRPTTGAPELLTDLEDRGVPFMIATSAGSEERHALLDVLGRSDVPTTDSSQVERSKPAPDLLVSAAEELGVEASAVTYVGDSPWDAEAATRLGMRAIGVLTGGFPSAVLREAGAFTVAGSPRDLIGRL